MLAIKDLNGEVYLLTGASNIVRKRRVNGEKELSLKLDKTKQNALFFDDIDKLWRIIDFNGEEYPIVLYRDVAVGNGYTREFSCIHSFFDDMRNHVIYETFSSSKTFDDMMNFIFTGSGYGYNIIGQFYASEWENFGDDYGLELFKKAIERYVAEFTVDGLMVNLRTQIGNTTDFQYRHKFNLESIERQVDALDFSTYGEGFGADGLHVTYTSPLAEIYGIRPIKAIRDERYTDAESLTNRVKETVDNSLKVTLTVKLADLRASGYNKNHPDEGDTIILVEDRLGLKADVRIVEIVELLSKNGKVLDCDVTLSNFSNIFEQQRRIRNATKTLSDAIAGKRPLPFEALSIAVQQATIALQNAQTELVFPINGGIMAVDKDNPNEIVVYNSKGLGISDDGGQTFETAITGKGIVADAITTGTLKAITIDSVTINGSLFHTEKNFQGPYYYTRQSTDIQEAQITTLTTYDGHPKQEYLRTLINPEFIQIVRNRDGYDTFETIIEDGSISIIDNDSTGIVSMLSIGAGTIGSIDYPLHFAASNVTIGNKLQVDNRGYLGYDAPNISLAIGDNDTGFDWVQDGYFDIMANNQKIAQVAPDRIYMYKDLAVSGLYFRSDTYQVPYEGGVWYGNGYNGTGLYVRNEQGWVYLGG